MPLNVLREQSHDGVIFLHGTNRAPFFGPTRAALAKSDAVVFGSQSPVANNIAS